MNAHLYESALEDGMQESMKFYGLVVGDSIFLQDNHPKYILKGAVHTRSMCVPNFIDTANTCFSPRTSFPCRMTKI
jgi:hypothetical protein